MTSKKVIRIWTELLEWERLGLVLEYFLRSESYDRLHTYSARGWPRPLTDRYFPQVVVLSDPPSTQSGGKPGPDFIIGGT